MNEPVKKQKRIGLILWSVLGLLILLIVVMMSLRRPPEKNPEAIEVAVPVATLELQPQMVTETLLIPGKIEPRVSTLLASAQDGLVLALGAEKGDAVTNGQLLMRVDNRQWEQARHRAEIEIREAGKDVQRWTELKQAGAVSINDYEDIRTRQEQAEIALAEASVFLSQCEVTSPLNGWVNNRMVELGEYVNKGTPVFEVVDIRQIKLVVDVPERDILTIHPGVGLPFTLSAYPGESFTGEVSFVSLLAQRESNAFRVEALAENPENRLKPGMIANVEFVRQTRPDSLLVPLQAVLPKKGEYVVFEVVKNRAVRRVIQLDAIMGHDALITGLQAGAELVVEGHRALQDGMLIERVPVANGEKTSDTQPRPEQGE